jgi:hypothetical protein
VTPTKKRTLSPEVDRKDSGILCRIRRDLHSTAWDINIIVIVCNPDDDDRVDVHVDLVMVVVIAVAAAAAAVAVAAVAVVTAAAVVVVTTAAALTLRDEHPLRNRRICTIMKGRKCLVLDWTRDGGWHSSRTDRVAYGFLLGSVEQSSPVLVLKLHGSINWLASIFGGVTFGAAQVDPDSSIGQHPVIHKADSEFLGYSDFEGHMYPGGGAFPSLILPGRKKEFFFRSSLGIEWKPFFDHLWSQASAALKHADKVVICGYNLLPVDERGYDLILRNPNKRSKVEIVCGSQGNRLENDFRNAGYEDIIVDAKGYFEDWVERRAKEQTRKENLKVDQVVRVSTAAQPS